MYSIEEPKWWKHCKSINFNAKPLLKILKKLRVYMHWLQRQTFVRQFKDVDSRRGADWAPYSITQLDDFVPVRLSHATSGWNYVGQGEGNEHTCKYHLQTTTHWRQSRNSSSSLANVTKSWVRKEDGSDITLACYKLLLFVLMSSHMKTSHRYRKQYQYFKITPFLPN